MAGIGSAPCRAVAAEDVRDLQRWTRHNEPRVRRAVQPSRLCTGSKARSPQSMRGSRRPWERRSGGPLDAARRGSPSISRQDVPWRYRVGRVVRRGALPRERFSPLALLRHAECIEQCPLSGVTRKTFAQAEFFSV
jgi:hypothetical protein